MPLILDVERAYNEARIDKLFLSEMTYYQKHYIGRPSPLYLAERMTAHSGGAKIYLKRDELNHTGAHKINNVLGQALLAKRMGKTKIIAETGAGQHGVATATACALFNMECEVFMGAEDVERQKPNAERMRLLGAKIHPVTSGTGTLKDAMNEALRYWVPMLKRIFTLSAPPQAHTHIRKWCVISNRLSVQRRANRSPEAKANFQMRLLPVLVVDQMRLGFFTRSLMTLMWPSMVSRQQAKDLVAAFMQPHLPAEHRVSYMVTEPIFCKIMKGKSRMPTLISAGLDYPGIGPEHSWLHDIGRVNYVSATDEEALAAFELCARLEYYSSARTIACIGLSQHHNWRYGY